LVVLGRLNPQVALDSDIADGHEIHLASVRRVHPEHVGIADVMVTAAVTSAAPSVEDDAPTAVVSGLALDSDQLTVQV
jgi:hypothetical protein